MSRSVAMSLRAFNALLPGEDAARAWFERARWPHGPQCPSCGVVGNAAWLKTRRKWRCRPCLDRMTQMVRNGEGRLLSYGFLTARAA